MSLSVREFELDKDSSDVKNWWNSQGWDESSIHIISSSGFIVENDQHKIAATWVIKTNSPIYMIEWTVGNPEVNWEIRKDALEQLTEYACNWAKVDGAKAIMIMTKNNRYIEKLKNIKFIESDNNMTHLVRSL